MSKLFKLKTFESNQFNYFISSVILPTIHFVLLKKTSKLLNVLIAWCERKLKRTKLKSKPFIYKIEVTANCNLKCPHCVEQKREHDMPVEKLLNYNDYLTIHNKIKKSAIRISYYLFGEPLTNPELSKMISIAAKDNIYTYFSSNFTLATKQKIDELVNAKLGEVAVALDGWTQEQYETYRIGGNIDVVKDGIIYLMKLKQKNKLKYPLLKVNTITFDHIKEDMDKIKKFVIENKVDKYLIKPNLQNIRCNSGTRPYSECFWIWHTMLIDSDGVVYPCLAQQRKRDFYFGNIKKDSLDEIWNSDIYLKMRKFLVSKNKEDFKNEAIPCINCKLYKD